MDFVLITAETEGHIIFASKTFEVQKKSPPFVKSLVRPIGVISLANALTAVVVNAQSRNGVFVNGHSKIS